MSEETTEQTTESTTAQTTENSNQQTQSTEVSKDTQSTSVDTETTKENGEEGKKTKTLEISKKEVGTTEESSVSLQDLVSELTESGAETLTEEQQEALGKLGVSEDMLETLVEAQIIKQEKNDQKVFDLVGSKDTYESMVKFATDSLSEIEIDAYNEAIYSGKPALAELAILGLKAKFEASKGPQGPSEKLDGSGNNTANNKGFDSRDEYLAARRSHKYKSDKAYRAEIESRRSKSQF